MRKRIKEDLWELRGLMYDKVDQFEKIVREHNNNESYANLWKMVSVYKDALGYDFEKFYEQHKMGIRKSHEIPQQETVYVVEKIVEYNIQSYNNDFVILYKTGDSNNVYRINVNDDFYDDVCVGDSITITIIK